ncbi:MAG TPA: CPBP family glutamic-type intramembrane protease [Thermoanaerobaculia bacterium]|nr:CPBP family glutamic-type intramembrane protease [Thermoanaerobaculia bacterium]
MSPIELLRVLGPLALAVVASFVLDRLCARKGLLPPGFREPFRRWGAMFVVAVLLWIAVFAPLGNIGLGVEMDVTQVHPVQLFLLHALMLLVLGTWFLLGFGGSAGAYRPLPSPPPSPLPSPVPAAVPVAGEPAGDPGVALEAASEAVIEPPPASPLPEGVAAPLAEPVPAMAALPPPVSLGRRFAEQFGLVAPSVPREIGLGLTLGLGAWVAVLVAVMLIGGLIVMLGGEDTLPQRPPQVVHWIAGLPLLLRCLVSLSAGVVEELFFRGFLQPRVGIVLSTAFFVLAHFSYGQPFMLIGITILSLIYAFLVRWRQSVWAAIAAHVLFDAIQLLVVIPAALRLLESQGRGAETSALLGLWPG